MANPPLPTRTHEESRMHPDFPVRADFSQLGRNWGWFLGLGIFFIVVGILAVIWPVRSTVGVTYALGAFFLIAGVASLIKAIELRRERGTAWRIGQTVISLAAGVVILRSPASGLMGITIGMTFYFFAIAAARAIAAFELRPWKGWGWLLASAVAAFLLGAYAMATFPLSALWMPGALLGVDFVIHGGSLIGLAFMLREIRGERRGAIPGEERKRAA